MKKIEDIIWRMVRVKIEDATYNAADIFTRHAMDIANSDSYSTFLPTSDAVVMALKRFEREMNNDY